MMTPDDKVGGWVKKGQNHDDVILEWSLSPSHKNWAIWSVLSISKDSVIVIGQPYNLGKGLSKVAL